jgi:hypothetical protein
MKAAMEDLCTPLLPGLRKTEELNLWKTILIKVMEALVNSMNPKLLFKLLDIKMFPKKIWLMPFIMKDLCLLLSMPDLLFNYTLEECSILQAVQQKPTMLFWL